MKKKIVLALVVSLFFSHVISPAFAGPMAKQRLSTQEIKILNHVQQEDTVVLAQVKAGSSEGTQIWAAVGVILLVVMGLAAMADNDDEETT